MVDADVDCWIDDLHSTEMFAGIQELAFDLHVGAQVRSADLDVSTPYHI